MLHTMNFIYYLQYHIVQLAKQQAHSRVDMQISFSIMDFRSFWTWYFSEPVAKTVVVFLSNCLLPLLKDDACDNVSSTDPINETSFFELADESLNVLASASPLLASSISFPVIAFCKHFSKTNDDTHATSLCFETLAGCRWKLQRFTAKKWFSANLDEQYDHW